jgi:hypothetical protein
MLGLLLAGALFLGALFSHRHVLVTAALIALITSLLANAATEGWRAYALFSTGRWTKLNGSPASRNDQPSHFWAWLSLHAVVAAVWCSVAGYLTWSVFASKL